MNQVTISASGSTAEVGTDQRYSNSPFVALPLPVEEILVGPSHGTTGAATPGA